jgi:MoxR-like ATPase
MNDMNEHDLNCIAELRHQVLQSVKARFPISDDEVDGILVGLLADGHVLIEGPTGVGKATLARGVTESLGLITRQLQMTVDLMPSDLMGYETLTGSNRQLAYQPGPIFANAFIVRQITMARPQLQAALLQVMQDRYVTIGGINYPQLSPFLMVATHSPVSDDSQHYALLDQQKDRFMLGLHLEYPAPQDESEYISNIEIPADAGAFAPVPAAQSGIVLRAQQLTREVLIATHVLNVITEVIQSTRHHRYIRTGASPRAGKMFVRACQAHALLGGRLHVTLGDVAAMSVPVLAHRLILNFDAHAESVTTEKIISEIVPTATSIIMSRK